MPRYLARSPDQHLQCDEVHRALPARRLRDGAVLRRRRSPSGRATENCVMCSASRSIAGRRMLLAREQLCNDLFGMAVESSTGRRCSWRRCACGLRRESGPTISPDDSHQALGQRADVIAYDQSSASASAQSFPGPSAGRGGELSLSSRRSRNEWMKALQPFFAACAVASSPMSGGCCRSDWPIPC